jgi:hypothetical protein
MIEEIGVRGVSNLHPVGTSRWVAGSTRSSIRGRGFTRSSGCVSPTPFTEPIDLAS